MTTKNDVWLEGGSEERRKATEDLATGEKLGLLLLLLHYPINFRTE